MTSATGRPVSGASSPSAARPATGSTQIMASNVRNMTLRIVVPVDTHVNSAPIDAIVEILAGHAKREFAARVRVN